MAADDRGTGPGDDRPDERAGTPPGGDATAPLPPGVPEDATRSMPPPSGGDPEAVPPVPDDGTRRMPPVPDDATAPLPAVPPPGQPPR
ncbi:MAG TPA: response regulator, partial [Pilimelia sp.]|nr:response regulator [Pilimelia sp.]